MVPEVSLCPSGKIELALELLQDSEKAKTAVSLIQHSERYLVALDA